VLPKVNRLQDSSQFNLTTKTGSRFSSESLHIYALPNKGGHTQIGFIVNRQVGGSVTRHLVSRKLRHNFANEIPKLSQNLILVVRVLRARSNYRSEVESLIGKINNKFANSNKADL
jgi:ribonuclease P protein component